MTSARLALTVCIFVLTLGTRALAIGEYNVVDVDDEAMLDAGSVDGLMDQLKDHTLSTKIGGLIVAKWRAAQTTSQYFIGQFYDDTFGSYPAIKALVIVPSEVFGDAHDEWDEFTVVAAVEQKDAAHANLWICAKNYKHRGRAWLVFGADIPSPDWQFDAADDGIRDARLDAISSKLVEEFQKELKAGGVAAPGP